VNLLSRIRALEVREGLPCPECGLTPFEGGYTVITYEGEEETAQQYCPQCGRPIYTIISVVYEGEGGRR
jgi:predicted RNA-binding Zn-ribbon protein involved in translation (DUF1610 family)